MLNYSLPYLFVLTLFGVCAFCYEYCPDNDKKKFNIAALLIFFIFMAFRGYVFTDWTTYADTMKNATWSDIFTLSNNKGVINEPGFSLLCCLCSIITREYAFLVFVVTVIDVLLLTRFFRIWKIENIGFILILFLVYEGLGIMFNLVRNQIAIFIFLNALEYIYKRKPLQYFGLCTLALCFHFSSLFYFPLYFFLHKKLNKWIFLGIYVASLLFYISHISILTTAIQMIGLGGALEEKAAIYTEFYSVARTLPIVGTAYALLLIVLLFLYYNEIVEKNKYRIMAINCLLMYFVCYYVLAEFKELSTRISMLFIFSLWVLWIDVVKALAIPNNRKLLGGLIFFFSFYITMFNIKIPAQQYDNLLFGAKSQQERIRIMNKTYEAESE